MCQEIDLQLEEVIIASFYLRIYDKIKKKVTLSRYITSEELARKLFDEQVEKYHNTDNKVCIILQDMDKCTNRIIICYRRYHNFRY